MEVHKASWWITKMESLGFVYDSKLTDKMKAKAMEDKSRPLTKSMEQTGGGVGQHIWGTLLVRSIHSNRHKTITVINLTELLHSH